MSTHPEEGRPRWTPDMPLRADATDLQMIQRYSRNGMGVDAIARELAAACVAATSEGPTREQVIAVIRRTAAGFDDLPALGDWFEVSLADAILRLFPSPEASE